MKIGILGGGQLGRMLALAGHPLGHSFVVFCPETEPPAAAVAEIFVADYTDETRLRQLASQVDVITYEFENVPAEAVELLREQVAVHPSARALAVSSDRLYEKELLARLSIPTATFRAVDNAAGMDEAIRFVGLPAVLKTRRFGYDGKGQRVLRTPADVEGAFTGLGGGPLLLEGFVPFERELSLISVRSLTGEISFYPLIENRHESGVLRLSRAPAADITPALRTKAEGYARALLEELNYVGVMAMELFQQGSELWVNELAPRVHNSGHWTTEGAETSQFENHLRAITGAPLGSTAARGQSAMINLIGALPDSDAILAVPGAHLHLYDKSPRPGRKLGHVTLTAPDSSTLEARLEAL